MMDLYEIADQIVKLLQQRGRLSYRVLKRQFDLSDEVMEDLKVELLFSHPVTDEDGRGLVWADVRPPSSEPVIGVGQDQAELLAYTPTYLADKILASRPALEGERKQVTVLFADIKDSTELIDDLDPEAAQQLLDPVIHIMMNAVHRFEGTVNQVLGDGIMALFGAPLAHEDHAMRACYSALAMQDAMRGYTDEVRRAQGIEMRIRVGLNSGEVVVRAIGNDLHMDYSAVGQTTHLAARMEQLATPGSIRLAASTFRLVEGLAQVAPLGPIPVKGLNAPVDVFELVGANPVRQRLQASVARGLTGFVGRDREIETVRQALELAESGYGQVVAAVGEAGVGKSRLIYEFQQAQCLQNWRVLESAAVSYGKTTPYFPIIELLKRYSRVEDGDDPRTIRAKMSDQILALDEHLNDVMTPLLSLLDALPDDSPFLRLEPTQRRQQTLAALKRLVLRESQSQPLILVVEDLHWIDSETQALLDYLVESLPAASLLLLVNYRPEYQHSWGNKTCYTQVRLDPLLPENAEMLLQALLGDDQRLLPLKKALIERTAGNPFFLEESVRTLAETEVLVGEPGAYQLTQEAPSIQLPPTVQVVISARIDRLPAEDKQLIQTAAVIGTEVSISVLSAIVDLPSDSVYRGLNHLQASEFMYETHLYPDHIYTFKHALTHEVAYSGLLHERRRHLHARTVDVLERLTDNQQSEQVESLAYHAFRGEVWDKALTYYRAAGRKAMTRSASDEAVLCFEQALKAIRYLPQNHEYQEQEIDIRLDLRNSRVAFSDLKAVLIDLQEAQKLAEALGDSQRLGRIYQYIALNILATGEYDTAANFAERALSLALSGEDIPFQAQANIYLCSIYGAQGTYARGRDHGRQAVELLAGDLRYDYLGEAIVPAVVGRLVLCVCLAEMGGFAEGISAGEEGMRIAEALNHPTSLMSACMGTGFVYLRQGELSQAIPLLKRAVSICREYNISTYFSTVAERLAAAYLLNGQVTDGLLLSEEAVAHATTVGWRVRQALNVAVLGEAHLRAGDLSAAKVKGEQALKLALAQKERGSEAHILRLLGEISTSNPSPDIEAAKAYYQQSLALAIELEMQPLIAHCHRDLGTLHRQVKQFEQAATELSAAIDIYRKMGMRLWLPETEAALAEVEGNYDV